MKGKKNNLFLIVASCIEFLCLTTLTIFFIIYKGDNCFGSKKILYLSFMIVFFILSILFLLCGLNVINLNGKKFEDRSIKTDDCNDERLDNQRISQLINTNDEIKLQQENQVFNDLDNNNDK